MTAPEKPAPSRDEILQSHLDRLHADMEALPGRVVWRLVLVGAIVLVVGWVAWVMVG